MITVTKGHVLRVVIGSPSFSFRLTHAEGLLLCRRVTKSDLSDNDRHLLARGTWNVMIIRWDHIPQR
jgi:hypothetical protein